MPSKPIAFFNDQQSAFDALAGGSPSAINVVVDAKGTLRRRPGIATYAVAPATAVDTNAISGLYTTAGGDLYAVAEDAPERPIYHLRGGAAVKVGEAAAGRGLPGSGRPTFAETEMLLVIAGGGQTEKVVLATRETSRLGGMQWNDQLRILPTHIVANASRLLANQTDTYRAQVHWSDVATGNMTYAGHEVWTYGVGTAGYFTQEARPDPVVAVGETTNEVWVWGSQTLQMFAPDPTTVYAPTSVIDHGCAAPYSPVRVDGQYAWIDDRRRIVLSNGRSLDVLSDGIQADLNGMSVISDAFGWRVITGRSDVLCWTFPTDGRTFTWQKGSGWGQWQGRSGHAWAPLGVTAHCLRRDTNANVVGTSAGYVARLDDAAGDDLGVAVVAEVVTGCENRETERRKHCEGITVVMRRDKHTTVGKLFVSYREGPWEAWEPDLQVELGTEKDPVVELNSLGVYRWRQWRFRFSGSGEFTLVSAIERYEVEDH